MSSGSSRFGPHCPKYDRTTIDPEFAPFFEQETSTLPAFYRRRIERDLGTLHHWLPAGAIEHDLDDAFGETEPASGALAGDVRE